MSEDQVKPTKSADDDLWDEPLSHEQLEHVLSLQGGKNNCISCGSYNWSYVKDKDDRSVLAWTYLMSGDPEEPYATISFYSRSCYTCGFMQNFSRVNIKNVIKRLRAEGREDV